MEKAMYFNSGAVVIKLALLIVGSALFLPETYAATNPTIERHHVQRRVADSNVRMMEVSTTPHAAPTVGPIEGSRSDQVVTPHFDNVAMISNTSPYSVATPAMDVSAAEELQAGSTAHAKAGYGLPLPEPDGWTAVLATVALGLFFFLRRIV